MHVTDFYPYEIDIVVAALTMYVGAAWPEERRAQVQALVDVFTQIQEACIDMNEQLEVDES